MPIGRGGRVISTDATGSSILGRIGLIDGKWRTMVSIGCVQTKDSYNSLQPSSQDRLHLPPFVVAVPGLFDETLRNFLFIPGPFLCCGSLERRVLEARADRAPSTRSLECGKVVWRYAGRR